MPPVAELVDQIAKLTLPQREELLHRLADSNVELVPSSALLPATPLITKTPGVCGGSARVIRTRIPVWTLERMRQRGMSEADILRGFPSLRAIDLVHAWLYADAHREEIEQDIRANEED